MNTGKTVLIGAMVSRNDPYVDFGAEQEFTIQVVADAVVQLGGIARAVLDFQNAMGGRIISLTRAPLVPLSDSRITHVPYAAQGALVKYGIPPRPALREAEPLIRGARLVVVHGLYRYHAQWALEVCRRYQIPYWVVLHGALDPYVFTYGTLMKRGWMWLVGKRLLSRAEKVIVTTRREAEKAAPFLSGCRVELVHLPVQTAGSGQSSLRSELRRGIGVADGERVLLFLGRLHPVKRVLETIDAFAAARRDTLHLVIVGPSSDQLSVEQCRDYVRSVGAERVVLVGPAFGADKAGWMSAADGYVSLSHKENFNYSAVESMAAGLPVILSPGNDISGELERVSPGWLLATHDPLEAAEAIRSFADATPDALRAFGEAGRSWVERNASPSGFSQRLAQIERNPELPE